MASASQYIPNDTEPLYAAAHDADFDHLGALGEAFHNAFKKCAHRTNDLLLDQLETPSFDPTFDNSYYAEYAIKARVPRIYEAFNDLLGDANFQDAPTWNDFKPIFPSFSQGPQQSSASAEYMLNAEQTWITIQNKPEPSDKSIPVYQGVAAGDLEQHSAAYKKLYQLFYDIQQTFYYCDFTMESAQLSFEKVKQTATANQILAERKQMDAEWKFILNEHIAQMRWGLAMWTRFNISEVGAKQMELNFNTNMDKAIANLETIDVKAIANKLGWNYEAKKATQEAKAAHWGKLMAEWRDTCKPVPEDRTIQTLDTICHSTAEKGLTFADIREGEKDAKAMWFEFFLPLLEQYKKDGGLVAKYDELKRAIGDIVINKGSFQSFRMEFMFLRTRVRYFELVPEWEIQRVRDDADTFFKQIESFRTTMIEKHGVAEEGDFHPDTLAIMEEKQEELTKFLDQWLAGEAEVFDDGIERERKTLRNKNKVAMMLAKDIYMWHIAMCYSQFAWKDGKAKDFESENFLWNDKTRAARKEYFNARNMYYIISRETKKFNFHYWRRI